MPQINLGDEVRCKVTGFRGIAVARTDWVHGCTRWCVQPTKLDKDGKPRAIETFDEPQLEVLKAVNKPKPPPMDGAPRGIEDRLALRRQ